MSNLTQEAIQSQPPHVETIFLTTPYVALCTPQGKDNPQFCGDKSPLSVYSHEDGDAVTPATFPLPGPLTLQVRLGFPVLSEQQQPAPSGVSVLLSGRVGGNPRIKIQPTSWFQVNNAPSLDTQVSITFDNGGNMPWGIREDIIWTLTFKWDAGGTMALEDFCRTPVELYCISPKLPFIYLSGVPLGLLRLFVEPACKLSTLHSLDDWVAWVTRRCHNSLAKDAGPVTVPGEEAIHYFRYNSGGSGAPRYTGQWGGGFSLSNWLHDREQKALHKVVNCYDQAGIVQLATLLGVPNGKIGWEHKMPFGYLNTINLIGWGNCNNPWFSGSTDDHVRFPKTDEDRKANKASFGNHSFIAYTKENGDIVAIDACAGPVTGTGSVDDYLKSTIYNDTGITTQFYKDWFGDALATNADYQRRNSITALHTHLGPGVVRVGKPDKPDDSVWAKRTGGIATYADLKNATGRSAFWTSLASYTPPSQASTQPKRVNISQFLDSFAEKARAQLGTSKADAIYHRQKPTVGQLGDSAISYQCGLDIVMPGESLVTLSLTIRVLDTADNALADLDSYLQAVSSDLGDMFQNLSNDNSNSHLGHLQLAAKAPHTLNIFLLDNMFIRVTALDFNDSATMVTAAAALLADAPAVDPPALAMTTPLETVTEGDEFSIVINAPEAGDVEVLDDESRLFPLTKTKDGDNWTLNFRVLGSERWTEAGEPLPDQNGVDNIVIFASAKDMEMLPSWISVPLTITS